MFTISTKILDSINSQIWGNRKIIFSTYSYNSNIPEEDTYYYRMYWVSENVYINGLSPTNYKNLQEKQNIILSNNEILLLIESLRNTIKKELRWRSEQKRPYLTHTLQVFFESEEIYLNNKYDNGDILIIQFIQYLDNLQAAYDNGEKLYFCWHELPLKF
jgi:hypothetical protein